MRSAPFTHPSSRAGPLTGETVGAGASSSKRCDPAAPLRASLGKHGRTSPSTPLARAMSPRSRRGRSKPARWWKYLFGSAVAGTLFALFSFGRESDDAVRIPPASPPRAAEDGPRATTERGLRGNEARHEAGGAEKLAAVIAPWNGGRAAFSTSWDDGCDPQVSFVPTLLTSHRIAGTFYISPAPFMEPLRWKATPDRLPDKWGLARKNFFASGPQQHEVPTGGFAPTHPSCVPLASGCLADRAGLAALTAPLQSGELYLAQADSRTTVTPCRWELTP